MPDGTTERAGYTLRGPTRKPQDRDASGGVLALMNECNPARPNARSPQKTARENAKPRDDFSELRPGHGGKNQSQIGDGRSHSADIAIDARLNQSLSAR
jgi:hypothetical protein